VLQELERLRATPVPTPLLETPLLETPLLETPLLVLPLPLVRRQLLLL
jgi:hypothetical protein